MAAEIKASYFAGNIKALSVLGPEKEAEARRRLKTIVDASDALSRAAWVPVAWDVELTHVLHELGGIRGVRDANKRAMLLSLEGPLMGPLASAAVSMFGPSPRTFIRYISKAWQAGARGMGEMTVPTLGDDNAVVVHRHLPAEVRSDSVWLEGWCGVMEGLYAATRYTGSAFLSLVDDDDGGPAARYDLSWRKT
ncbi:MAG: hypothetical protein Q8O67_24510 [Deltaproteobacteria bacterium]|nr:hypothetical protein [Deltaproteobacteria bacterium]